MNRAERRALAEDTLRILGSGRYASPFARVRFSVLDRGDRGTYRAFAARF